MTSSLVVVKTNSFKGGAGKDILIGGGTKNVLKGGAGDDILIGGGKENKLIGGKGQ